MNIKITKIEAEILDISTIEVEDTLINGYKVSFIITDNPLQSIIITSEITFGYIPITEEYKTDLELLKIWIKQYVTDLFEDHDTSK